MNMEKEKKTEIKGIEVMKWVPDRSPAYMKVSHSTLANKPVYV